MIKADTMRVDHDLAAEKMTVGATFTIRDQDKRGLEWAHEHTSPRWPFLLSRAEILYLQSAPREAEAVFEPECPALPESCG